MNNVEGEFILSHTRARGDERWRHDTSFTEVSTNRPVVILTWFNSPFFFFFFFFETHDPFLKTVFPACSAVGQRGWRLCTRQADRPGAAHAPGGRVRRGAAPGAARRRPGGVCAAAGGSCRRPSRGPAACCTPRPPPRSRTCLRPERPGWAAWSSAPRRSSSATWCAGSGTTPAGGRSGAGDPKIRVFDIFHSQIFGFLHLGKITTKCRRVYLLGIFISIPTLRILLK